MISSQSSVSPVGRQRPPRLAQGSPQSATATAAVGGDAALTVTLRVCVGSREGFARKSAG